MDSKNYTIITGATSGIGYETANKLYSLGYNLILANRNQEKAEKVKREIETQGINGSIVLMHLNLASFTSIKKFVKEVKENFQNINILINNAGVLMRDNRKTEEGFELTLGVNHLGTYLLTELLIDKLLETENPKIIMVSSIGCYWGNIKINDNTFYKRINVFKNYFDSKLGNLIYTKELADKHKNISVLAADPGVVYSKIFKWKTKFGHFLEKIQKLIMKSPEQGADVIVKLVTTSRHMENNYLLYSIKKPRKLPRKIRNEQIRRKYIEHTSTVISEYI